MEKGIWLCLVFVLLPVISATAQEGPMALDQDGDSRLTWQEAEQGGWNKDTFELKDMDSDGYVTDPDLKAHVDVTKTPVLNVKILKAMDKNKDKKISMDEWWWGEKEFKQFDRDKNGILGPKELARIPKAKKLEQMMKKMKKKKEEMKKGK